MLENIVIHVKRAGKCWFKWCDVQERGCCWLFLIPVFSVGIFENVYLHKQHGSDCKGSKLALHSYSVGSMRRRTLYCWLMDSLCLAQCLAYNRPQLCWCALRKSIKEIGRVSTVSVVVTDMLIISISAECLEGCLVIKWANVNLYFGY